MTRSAAPVANGTHVAVEVAGAGRNETASPKSNSANERITLPSAAALANGTHIAVKVADARGRASQKETTSPKSKGAKKRIASPQAPRNAFKGHCNAQLMSGSHFLKEGAGCDNVIETEHETQSSTTASPKRDACKSDEPSLGACDEAMSAVAASGNDDKSDDDDDKPISVVVPPVQKANKRIKATSELGKTPIDILRLLWRKQVPYLYDLVVTHRREAPVAAVAWLPGSLRHTGGALQQRMVVSSRARSSSSSSELLLLSVTLPGPAFGSGSKEAPQRIVVTHRFPHDGPADRISCSPHRLSLISTRNSRGDVLIFDFSTWGSTADASSSREPNLRLCSKSIGSVADAAGLVWDPWKPEHLLAAGPGPVANIWDCSSAKIVAQFAVGSGSAPAADVTFCPSRRDVLAACGNDGRLLIFDTRTHKAPMASVAAHDGGAHCAAFGGEQGDALLASGGADGIVRLWDPRALGRSELKKMALCSLSWPSRSDRQSAPVRRLAWSPPCCSGSSESGGVLAAALASGRVLLWDICGIALPEPETSAEPRDVPLGAETPPGLLFVHGGHVGHPVADVAWSVEVPWLLASSSFGSRKDSNGAVPGPPVGAEMQIWTPAEALRS